MAFIEMNFANGGGDMELVKIYENSNSQQSAFEQTANLSSYDVCLIEFISDTSSGITSYAMCPVGKTVSLNTVVYANSSIVARNRNVTLSTDKITVANGTQNGSANTYINLVRTVYGIK